VEYTAFYLARKFMEWNEPIPDFSTGGKIAYRGITAKAAMFFYLMIKNHPFQNRNKRVAMTTLMYFLHKNKKWLRVDNDPKKILGEKIL
jgi:prophage maintenance system killer protein